MNFNENNPQPYDWENEGVYQIEATDYVEGGPEGVSNRQAKELTRRTRNLHVRMATAEGEIDTLQEQTPIQVEAALRGANQYTDGKDTVVRNDMAIADNATLRNAKDYADRIVAALVDNSPEALNTLQELAAALGNDPNFATTVMQAVGERAKTSDVNVALARKANTADMNTALAAKANCYVITGIAQLNYFTENATLCLLDIQAKGTVFGGCGTVIQHTSQSGGSWESTQLFMAAGSNTLKLRRVVNGAQVSMVDLYHTGNLKPATIGASTVSSVDNIPYDGANLSQTQVSGVEYCAVLTMLDFINKRMQLRIKDYEGICTAYIRGENTKQWRELYHTGNLQPTPLASYKIAANRTILKSAGPKKSTATVDKNGDGHYIVYHTIGNTDYYTIPVAYGNRDLVCHAFIIAEHSNRVEIGVSNMNGGFCNNDFEVVLMPNN